MAERRIPDPTLMARLQLSAKGVDWAASLTRHRQHEARVGAWSAHQHVHHLLRVEREVHQARVRRMLAEDNPAFENWDEEADMREHYRREGDVMELAEQFMRERDATFEMFKALSPADWARHGRWPSGEVDVAWAAERAVAHALEHFVGLLRLHEELEPFHAAQWSRG